MSSGLIPMFEITNGVVSRTTRSNFTFSGVKYIPDYGLYSYYMENLNILTVNFPNLISIGTYGLRNTFDSCTNITYVSFPKLKTVGFYSMYRSFRKTNLTSISFPSLITVDNMGLFDMFYQCTNLTEIHFKSTAQSAISSASGYSDKFGANNATIYFDL